MDDERVEYSFVWLIENFSYCWHKEKLTSPVFYAFELEDTSWRMVLYPRGERDKDYISFYLFRNTEVNGPENVSLNYKLSGPAELGSSIRSEEGNYTFTKGHGREWPRFVKIEEIPYLSRDIMVVKCRVRKGGGKVQKVTTIRARTRIAVEKVSFVHEVENFSTLKPSEKKAIEKQSGSKEGFSVSSSLYFDFDSSCEGEMTIEITPSDGTYILCKRKISLFDASGNVIECSENDNRFDVEEKNIQKLPLPLARQDILNKKSVYLPGDRLSLLCECAFSTGLEYDHIELIRTKEVSDWLQPHFESMGKRLKLEFTNEDKPDRGVGNITLEMGVENFSTTSEIASVFHGEEDKPILYRVRVFAGNIGGWLAVSPEVKIFHEEAWDIYFIPNYLWWTVSIIDTKGHSRFPQYFEKYPDKDEDETDELREAKYLEKSFILDRADELLSEDVLSLRCDIHFDLDVIQEIWASSEQKFNDVDFFSFVRKILWKLYFTPDDHAEFRYKDLKIVRVLKVHDLTFQNLTLPESYPFGVHDISPDPKSISSESGEDIADILKDVWMFDTNPDRFLLSITRRPGNLGRFLIASSPVIRRCIDTPMREQGEKRIQLSNVDGLIFTMVLYFLKCGRIPRCKFDELVEIYEFSHFYLMENLQFRSAKCMAEKCDSISLLEEIKSMADLNSDEYLLKLLDRRRRELEELSRGLELKKHGNPDAVEDRPDFDCFI
ncbi:unnamed protein product [Larinioides sclopetarius]|uniref:MATH domain-containing protein n=1 Tax=Larinioides sclopetarius TaxID=280406 RepID=A0AAV2BP87_9ARAC